MRSTQYVQYIRTQCIYIVPQVPYSGRTQGAPRERHAGLRSALLDLPLELALLCRLEADLALCRLAARQAVGRGRAGHLLLDLVLLALLALTARLCAQATTPSFVRVCRY